mgnify:FL=1
MQYRRYQIERSASFREACHAAQRLILVTGLAGSGKSTTLAAMIDFINRNKSAHIVTLEDPPEYRFTEDKSIISQRQVGSDTASFALGLRAALRQDPDVIMIGELRDAQTAAGAVSAAETGHLVLATLHTRSAVLAVSRMLDFLRRKNSSKCVRSLQKIYRVL